VIEAEVTIRIYDDPDDRYKQHGAHFAPNRQQAEYLIALIRSWRYDWRPPLVKPQLDQVHHADEGHNEDTSR
jgi:hypothetical protein